MSNLWKQGGIPHKGWELDAVYDVREDGQPIDETEYETCMMCNNERVRYVHVVSHKEIDGVFKVGCICAEKMTNDRINPKRLEKELKKRALKRTSWVKKKWKITGSGNQTLIFEGRRLLIFRNVQNTKYKCKVAGIWGKNTFDTIEQAKNAIFTGIELMKERGKW